MDMPERIFIGRCHPCNCPRDYYVWDSGTEYRRADLPPTLEAAKVLPEIAALVEEAKENRLLTSTIMKALMQQGRAGLLLADELHKADDKIRNALTAILRAYEAI